MSDYDHDNKDPNLNNLHKAMIYDDDGEPALRVSIEKLAPGVDLVISGDVIVSEITGTVEINNDVGSPIPVSVQGDVSLDVNSESPLPVIGTTINPWGHAVLQVDDDTVQHTSTNRRKVSTYEIVDFCSYQYDKEEEIWDEKITGTGSTTFEQYMGMVRLEVGGNAGDQVIRQTKRVQRYIPGRPAEVSCSLLFGTPELGIRRRYGIFNENNGAFFEDGGDGTYYVVCRRNTPTGVVEERVAREDWNKDKLDGTGPSGITADPTAIQLIVIEYEWYGAGHVEVKFIINNNAIPVHQFDHANYVDYTWSNTAFLPIRVELTNVGGVAGTHTFYQGSHSFWLEGNNSALGRESNVSSPVTGYDMTLPSVFYPIVSIRLKSSRLQGVVIPTEFSAATLDNTNIFYKIVRNGTLTGGTWQSMGTESHVEYCTNSTAITGGDTLQTGFVSSGNQGTQFTFPSNTITQLGRRTTTTLADTSDIFTVCVAAINSNKDAFASLTWIEVR